MSCLKLTQLTGNNALDQQAVTHAMLRKDDHCSINTVVLKLFSLRRLWKGLLDLRRTSNKMLIRRHVIKVL